MVLAKLFSIIVYLGSVIHKKNGCFHSILPKIYNLFILFIGNLYIQPIKTVPKGIYNHFCSFDIYILEILVFFGNSNSEGSGEPAHAQSRQSLHCSHTQSRNVDERLRANFQHIAPLGSRA